MPELPELTIFSRSLHQQLHGKKVDCTEVYRTKRLNVSPDALNQALAGSSLQSVDRKGKEIRFCFSNGHTLSVHLMLTGQFKLSDEKPESDSQRLMLHFEKGPYLVVSDYKGWATFKLDPYEDPGPDPLSTEFNFDYLEKAIHESPSMNIKAFLMDQDKVGGIGNAYSDEILWASRISPKSKCGKLPEEAIRKLYDATKTILSEAVQQIEKDFPGAVNGKPREFLKIHNPEFTTSPTGHAIICEEINGRKAYFTDEQTVYE